MFALLLPGGLQLGSLAYCNSNVLSQNINAVFGYKSTVIIFVPGCRCNDNNSDKRCNCEKNNNDKIIV